MQPEAPHPSPSRPRNSWLPGRADLPPAGRRRRAALGCLAAAAAALVLAGLLGAWALARHGDAIAGRLAYWVSTNIMLQVDASYDQATKAGLRDELARFLERGFRGELPAQAIKPVIDRLKTAMEDGTVTGTELAPIMDEVRRSAGPAPLATPVSEADPGPLETLSPAAGPAP